MPCAYMSPEGKPCQFNRPEDQLYEYREITWCRYHLPCSVEGQPESPKDGMDLNSLLDPNRLLTDALREGAADLTGIQFPEAALEIDEITEDVSFQYASFSGPVRCRSLVAKGRLDFTKARFGDGVSFVEAKFHEDVIFREASFSKKANFGSAQFSNEADFRDTHFGGDAVFSYGGFSRAATFDGAKFLGVAVFQGRSFDFVSFRHSVFESGANFREAAFRNRLNFRRAVFVEACDFSTVNVGRDLPVTNFRQAAFHGFTSFVNRNFTVAARFDECVFDAAPLFHECELHQDTSFDGADFRDTRSRGAARAYRTLKLAMEEHRSRNEEGYFYALEQRSARYSGSLGRWDQFMSWLYDETSGYGQDSVQPLCLLLAIWLVFGMIFGLMGHPAGLTLEALRGGCSFSLAQIIRPLRILGVEEVTWTCPGLLLTQAISSLESILTSACIALSLLSLRWRFRRG
ncbi:pentapeptide repeat-containing protein [Candidatus Latescibacterota bacterium]